jgi:nucleoside-diphosphate-sugar epimerase
MRILVAGGTGDVGLPLVRRLIAGGHEVVAMSRGRRSNAAISLGARSVVADALDLGAVRRAVREPEPEAIVDLLTALPRNGPTRPSHLEATNELRRVGSANLYRAAESAGVRRYVAESIVFVYGYEGRDRVWTESDPVGPATGSASRYSPALEAARGKERLVTEGSVEGVALRFGLLYGPGAGSTLFMARMLGRRMLGLPGGGRGIVPWIHVEDAASAVVAALERGEPGEVINVADDQPASFRAFASELADRIGTPRPYGIPTWLARPFVPYATLFMSGSRLRVSNEKAKNQLGWKPMFPTYREGLGDVAAALKDGAQRP